MSSNSFVVIKVCAMTCNVKGCGNYLAKTRKIEGNKIKYFSFPKNPALCNKWRQACGKENISPKYARICSKHFADEAFTKPLQEYLLGYSPTRTRNIRPDAIPTLHLHAVPPLTSNENVLAETMPLPVSNKASMDVEQTPASSSIEEQTPASSSIEEQTPASSSTEEQTPASSSTEAIMLSQIRRLKAQLAALKKTIDKTQTKPKDDKELMEKKMTELLGKMFSPGQIRMILNPSLRKIKWSSEDIARAISLRCVSPKAYRYMKNVLQMPLPGFSTLRRWASTVNVEPGILSSVLYCMIAKRKCMPDIERLVVLTFDEIYINNKVAIDRKVEKVIGPHKTCQCVMVRSLFASWKQPVYYQYDEAMDVRTLNNIISQLHDAGYTVVTITSDMGPGNLKLWSQLEIGMHPKKSYFQHPA